MTETQRKHITGHSQGIVLHGERIYLRPPVMGDAHYVFNWERDDEVWRYDPKRPFSRNFADFLSIFEQNYVHSTGRQFWFIIEDEQHIPIGTITYFSIDSRLRQAEVGLGLGDKTRWGKGYGTEAIRTLVQYLFTLPDLLRVYAETAVVNWPARRAFVKANFIEVGQIYDPRSSGEPWVLLEIWKRELSER